MQNYKNLNSKKFFSKFKIRCGRIFILNISKYLFQNRNENVKNENHILKNTFLFP